MNESESESESKSERGSNSLPSAKIIAITRALAVVRANPAIITIDIETHQPTVKDFHDIIEILRLSIRLTFRRTGITLGETLVIVETVPGHKPAVVRAKGDNGVAARGIQL